MGQDKRDKTKETPDSEYGVQGSPKLGAFNQSDVGFGARHWGHGEYKGEDTPPESLKGNAKYDVNGRFYGVGPKGYKRSDERVLEDCNESLARHHEIDASDVEVSVKDGVVTLSGSVDTRRTKRMTEDAIDHVMGVVDVQNQLRILR